MALLLSIGGQLYSQAKSVLVRRSMRDLAGQFQAVSSAGDRENLPVSVGQVAQVVTEDGEAVFTGFIETLEVSYSSSKHEISISGRGLACDLVDSTMETLRYGQAMQFPALVSSVLGDIGVSFSSSSMAGSLPEIQGPINAKIGQTGFDFLNSYGTRIGAIMITDGRGNIIITKGNQGSAPDNLLRISGGRENNVTLGGMTIDHGKRYNRYLVSSQQSFFDSELDPADISGPSGSAEDSLIRSSRRLQFDTEEASDPEGCTTRAELEANVRRSLAMQYTATVAGHGASGRAWDINRTVLVRDDFCDIDAQLLIYEIEMSYDDTSGSTTRLSCTFEDAYTFMAELDALSASRSNPESSWVSEL